MLKAIFNYLCQTIRGKKPLLRFLAWLWLANAILFVIVGSRYLVFTLYSTTLFETSFFAYTSICGKALVLAFTLFSFIGQLSLLAALPLMTLVLPFIFLINRRLMVFLLAIMVSSFSLILLMVDTLVFSLFHFHLNFTMLSIAFDKKYNFIHFLELSFSEVLWIAIGSITIFFIESILTFLIWKKIVIPNRLKIEKKGILLSSSFLGFSYLIVILSIGGGNNVFIQQTPNLPLYNHILASILPLKNSFSILERVSETHFSQPLFASGKLNYPLHPLSCEAKKKPYNILIIGIDTWRFDSVKPSMMPNMARFAQTSWQFSRHYSGGNSTQAGLFSLFYALPSNYWTATQEHKQGPVFISELLKQGYQTTVMFSSDMIPPFQRNAFVDIPNLRVKHAFGNTIPDRDLAITAEFKQFLLDRNKSAPFFSFILYDAAHGYCTPQPIPNIFPTTGKECGRLNFNQQYDLKNIIHRYQNALHFVDQQVGEIMSILRSQQLLDNTIVIITGDHGEEFDDTHQGYIGHASNYSLYQIQTPLFIHWPKQAAKKWQHQTSHYDIVPTLMKNALGCRNLASDYSVGKHLSEENKSTYFLAGSYMNMAIIQNHKTTTLQTNGHIHIADEMSHQIVNEKPDMKLIQKALADMRKFFLRF